MIKPQEDRAWWFHTTFDPAFPRARREAWYRRLHKRLTAAKLAAASAIDISVVLGIRQPFTAAARNVVIAWLIDDPNVWVIQIGEMAPVEDLVLHGVPAIPVADIWRATGLPRSRLDDYMQHMLKDIVRAAVADRIVKRRPRRGGPA
jgi:hypothetical protein